MQIFSVTSGKGGVGKTSLICNLAVELGRQGRKVLLIDADMGLANVDIMLGLSPKATLAQFFAGEAELSSLLIEARSNVTVLPAASGVREVTHLSDDRILMLMSALDALDTEVDVLLVDTGAGIGKNVLAFNAAAGQVLVVATPEPTSMTDAYATMKVLSTSHSIKSFHLVVNMVDSRKEALRVFRHLTTVADQFLDIAINFTGFIVRDDHVRQAIVERVLLIERYPNSPAAEGVRMLAETLGREGAAGAPSGQMQFFWRRLLGQEPAR
ncbi:MAG: MinD/ParA family protein [Myxococcales bacterium]|nr:MinD/ParA family protein [Myxococcales bacterium]